MARLQLFLALFLVLLFSLWTCECQGVSNDANSHGSQKVHPLKRLHRSECPSACSHRCSKTTKKACMYFCQYCCNKCLCVPPGTYGNKELCPCYNNWKTKEGGPKCP